MQTEDANIRAVTAEMDVVLRNRLDQKATRQLQEEVELHAMLCGLRWQRFCQCDSPADPSAYPGKADRIVQMYK